MRKYIIQGIRVRGIKNIIIVLIIISQFSKVQAAGVDSLLNAWKEAGSETEKVHSLIALSQYYAAFNADSALYFSQKAEKVASRENYTEGRAKAKIAEGKANEAQEKYNIALTCYQQALAIVAGSGHDELDAQIKHQLGELHMNQGRFEEAAGFLLEAQEKFTKSNNREGFTKTTISLGNLFLRKSEPAKALQYFDKAKEQSSHNLLLLTQINVSRGMAYHDQKMPDSARSIYLEALEILQKNGMKNEVSDVLNKLGDLHYKKGDYNTAIGYYKHALGIKEEINDKEGVFYSLNALGRTYAVTKNPINALSNAEAALQIALSRQNKNGLMEVYQTLAEVHEYNNSPEQAVKFYKLHQQYKDSIYSIEKEKALATLAALHDLSQKEKEMALLKKENELQENLNGYQQVFLIIAGIVIFFILGIAILLFRTNKSKEKLHQRLHFKSEAIGKQNALLVKQKEEIVRQRDKIQVQADNLREMNLLKNKLFSIIGHDLRSPFSQLKGLFILLEMKKMKPDQAEELLHGIRKNVNQLNDMLENLLAWAKSQMDRIKPLPAEINVYDIADGCVDLFKETAKNKEIRIKNKVNKKHLGFADPDMTELVVRNILSNAVKFCNKGDSITLASDEKEDEITITIRDTGVGMNAEALDKLFTLHTYTTLGTDKEKGTGLGMHLCHEFARQNGGRLWVESEPGAGTTLFFTIPAPPEEEVSELLKTAPEKVSV